MSIISEKLQLSNVNGQHSIRTDFINGKMISSMSIHYDFILPDTVDIILLTITKDAEKIKEIFANQLRKSEI